jgi:hypothetical protein
MFEPGTEMLIMVLQCVFGVKIPHECFPWPGKARDSQVECLSQAKKSTSVIFYTPKTHKCCFVFITCHYLLGNRDFNGHFVLKK